MEAAREELATLWAQHLSVPFPSSIDKGDERWLALGVDPVMLDSNLAGAISGVLSSSRTATDEQGRRLRDGLRDIDATAHLVPEDARAYFSRLRRMAELALVAERR